MTYLIDTDRAADYLKKRGIGFTLLPQLKPDGLAISIVTYAELCEGVFYGTEPTEEARALQAFVDEVEILPVSVSIARRFAEIRGQLRRAGNLIPDMDLFIAATAIEHGLTLITGNRRHFDRLAGLEMLV